MTASRFGAPAGVLGTGLIVSLLGRCDFPPARTEVDCAVSGGADSLALLALAVAAGLSVTAIHVDHGLRPGSSDEAAHVAQVAGRLGAEYRALRVTIAPGANLEARARQARYDVLPEGVLTGHTADDQAETVLVNLLRGAGLDGLAGMGRAAPRVRRPLLALRRDETRGLCQQMGLGPVEDESNADRRFVRNRIRHDLLPRLAEIAGRDLVPILARQADLLSDEARFLDALAAQVDPCDARSLAAADPVIARRAVRRWLRGTTGADEHPPSAAEVERVLDVARGRFVACELSGGRRIRRSKGRLLLQGERAH